MDLLVRRRERAMVPTASCGFMVAQPIEPRPPESREIYRDHRCEVIFRILGERLGDEDACVVDKRIYSSEVLGSRAQNAFGRLGRVSPSITRIAGSLLSRIERELAIT
jgi:hypothetical protein